MAGIFSFIKQPSILLLETSVFLIPGIEKAIALFYDSSSQQVLCKELQNNSTNSTINDFFISEPVQVQKMRNKKFQWQWMSVSQLPFEAVNNQVKQLTIFDELQNIVLCLGFNNPLDGHADLLFLYLNRNNSCFGVSDSNSSLTTNEKSIIGSLVFNSLNWVLQQKLTDSQTLISMNQKMQYLQVENKELNDELGKIKLLYGQSLVAMCRQYLADIETQHNVRFDFDAGAIQKIVSYVGNSDQLIAAIEYSAKLAINLNFGNPQSTIVLKSWELEFENPKLSVATNTQHSVNERYLKTIHLLDKLESAACLVSNSKQRLTGENVGNACPSPISAPAITDALKNHQKKVLHLMEEFPDKWMTIRNEFRPIKNILLNQQVG
ncbi:MAG: hypothetical protein WCX31_08270 [Salinivirgaceae bacterium]|jgi:hypothetical protein